MSTIKRKSFKIIEGDGKEIELVVRSPQSEDYDESDRIYACKVASLVRETGKKKLLLRSEIEGFLREQGIWTKTDETNLSKIQKDIDFTLGKLRAGGIKLSEVRNLCLQVMDKRKDMIKIHEKRRIFDNTTIESIAENERNDYLVYSCTVYSDSGKNYWLSFEDMKNDKMSHAYRNASVAAIQVIYGVNPEFEKTLPENKLLLKYGFIDEELNYVDRKTKEKVDRDGRPISILETEAVQQFNNLQGDIEEKTPFIDDETGEPIKIDQNTEPSEIVEIT